MQEHYEIIIVGGGSAGWLSAGVIAAEHGNSRDTQPPFELVLIESPDVPTIGVGEGTWPSMRATLERIGLSETDFIRESDASFKQGTFFGNWQTGAGDTYTHPFSVPSGYADINLAPHWLAMAHAPPFADAVRPGRDRFLFLFETAGSERCRQSRPPPGSGA